VAHAREETPMIGVIVSFRSEGGLDRSAVMAVAEQAAPAFEVTGLYGVRPEVRFVEVGALVDNGVAAPA